MLAIADTVFAAQLAGEYRGPIAVATLDIGVCAKLVVEGFKSLIAIQPLSARWPALPSPTVQHSWYVMCTSGSGAAAPHLQFLPRPPQS